MVKPPFSIAMLVYQRVCGQLIGLRYRDGTSSKTCKLRGEILLLSDDELAIKIGYPLWINYEL